MNEDFLGSFDQCDFLVLRSLLPDNLILFPIWKSLDELINLLGMLDCNDEVKRTFIADTELWNYLEKLPSILD